MSTFYQTDPEEMEAADLWSMENGEYPAYFIPTRYFVNRLEVGHFAPDCFGKPARVVEIYGRGDDVKGKAFVCYRVQFGPPATSTITNSLKEGELLRSTRICHQHTSHELDEIEARILQEQGR